MRYVTCEEIISRLNLGFGCDCVQEIYINKDGSVYGANVGNMYFDSDELTIKTGLILDRFRVLNNWNLKTWKGLYGKKEESK